MTTFSTALISEADYCAIEDALQSTEKGRRFLRAYVDRNRGLESLRLLRSISRLHRAALGAPGLNAELSRDLTAILKNVSRCRQKASECETETAGIAVLTTGFEEIEACLIALLESLEERTFDSLNQGPTTRFQGVSEIYSTDRSAKLYGELSSLFSTEPR